MTSIKDMVKDGQKVKFMFYRSNELWYVTECGFEFPVPTYDCGDGVFLAEDKAMLFMRYIRKHIKYLEDAKKEAVDAVFDRPDLQVEPLNEMAKPDPTHYKE